MSEKSRKDQVWDKAKIIPGEDPNRYRTDPYGNIIRYDHYGQEKRTGWEIDHIIPKARGGGENLRNLQALQTATNREKADSLVKRNRHAEVNK